MEGEDEERSECSSGCRSGWTMYLDQSYENHHPTSERVSWQEEVEEDLSMISDASSGPPHYQEDDLHCFNGPPIATLPNNSGQKKRAATGKQYIKHEPQFSLDDTASSPVFGHSKNNMDDTSEFSCGFSATHLKGKSVFQKHLGRSTTKPATSMQ